MQKWVALNHCATQATKAHIPDKNGDGTSVDIAIQESCAEGTEVRDYISGKTTKNMDASEVIWEFFARHSR